MRTKLERFSSFEILVNTKHIATGDGFNVYVTYTVGKCNINIVNYVYMVSGKEIT